MSHVIGRGRHARETYPERPLGVAPFSVPSSFVWRQDDRQGRNVFGDFPSLYVATSTLDPASIKWVAIDSTADLCRIPSGAWDLSQFKFYNTIPNTPSETILVEDGAVISFGELELHNGITLQSQASAAPVVVESGKISALRMYNGHALSLPGAAPFAHCESGGNFSVHMFENSSMGGTNPFIQSDVGSATNLVMNDNTLLHDANLSGAGPITVQASASASVSLTQPGLTGLLTVTYPAVATQVTYAADPTKWVAPPPTTLKQAVDRIAANTTNAHPIP